MLGWFPSVKLACQGSNISLEELKLLNGVAKNNHAAKLFTVHYGMPKEIMETEEFCAEKAHRQSSCQGQWLAAIIGGDCDIVHHCDGLQHKTHTHKQFKLGLAGYASYLRGHSLMQWSS